MARYPVNEETVRPYRLWNAGEKAQMPYRYYAHPRSAHIGALIEMKYSKVGMVIEVINVNRGALLQQYIRGVNDIKMPKSNGSTT